MVILAALAAWVAFDLLFLAVWMLLHRGEEQA
jgi:hypothetical protein